MKYLTNVIFVCIGIWLVSQYYLVGRNHAEAGNGQNETANKKIIASESGTSYSCYLPAPGYDVQVRVYSVNDYREREVVIWSGLIEANQQKMITSKREVVLYNFR